MLDETQTRFLALVELVREDVQAGISPNQSWVQEIMDMQQMHPDWVPPAPPPPSFEIDVSSFTPPPPPSNGHSKAAIPNKPGERIDVEIDEHTERLVDTVLNIVGQRYTVFQNGGRLLELQTDPGKDIPFLAREINPPRMVTISPRRMWSIASRECRFVKTKIGKGGTPTMEAQLPPEWLGGAIVAKPRCSYIPVLSGVSQAPTLRADGALIYEPGFDESTGIYLATDITLSIPEAPTQADAMAAYRRLIDLVCDYEFVNEAAASVWLAGLLSVACRHTFDGPAPLFIFDASKRASGKTKLANIISIITTGVPAACMYYTSDNIEMDKRISALGLAGDQMVLIDNVVGKLASPPLDAALTSTSYKGRMLGKSEMTPALSMKIVWFATGNGMMVGADTARRSLAARIVPSCDYPEDRTGPRPGQVWKYPDLIGYVKANHKRLLADCLTIVSAYIRAGRPTLGLQTMESFDQWSATIRNAVVWGGGKDPCGTIIDVRKADPEDLAVRRMVECWPVADGVEITAAGLAEWAVVVPQLNMDPTKRDKFEAERVNRQMWRSALLEWLPAKPGSDLPTAREIGYALRGIDDAVIGGFKIKGGEHQKSGIPWTRISIGQVLSFSSPNGVISEEKAKLSLIK